MKPSHIFLASICCALLTLPLQASDYVNELGMEFTKIKAGTFMMGDDPSIFESAELRQDEGPRHKVTITRDFYIGTYEVTQAQWEMVMGYNPSYKQDSVKPISNVAPREARVFIDRLNGLGDGNVYRLPTEAEWEYAARAGTLTPWHFGATPDQIGDYAWTAYNSKEPMPVGGKLPNPWGLHDTLGNVSELVSDYYSMDYFQDGPERDPTGPGPDDKKSQVVRGGGFQSSPSRNRSSYRFILEGDSRDFGTGLRLVVEPGTPKSAPPAPKVAPDYKNALGMEFVKIRAGSFMMGNDPSKYDAGDGSEEPRHRVTITRDFYIGVFEVTQAQWEKVMGNNPSSYVGPDRPVDNVSPGEALGFIRRLNQLDDGHGYRLPTEAEWEYAVRAGTETPWHFGGTPYRIADYDWVSKDLTGLYPVGGKLPNPWGLHDVYGNASEVVSDYYDSDYYKFSPERDPLGPGTDRDSTQVVRGGSWFYDENQANSSARDFLDFGSTGRYVGFRLAASAVPQKNPAAEGAPGYTNQIGMEFTRITAGTFMMGDDPSKYPAKIWHPNDVPQHKVAITRDFFIGTYEVTQAQWEKVMGTNPSYDKGRDKPITGMTFEEVRDFIGRLNKMDGAMAYRLPTEAEWEYAARAGTETPWFFGETPEELEKYAWASYYVKGQRPVGRKLPNPWGLFDVHGNVSELVSDYYSQDYYSHSPERDPTGPEPENGGSLVVRGGSWNDLLDRTRSSHRDFLEAGKRGENIGLRLAFTSIPDKAD